MIYLQKATANTVIFTLTEKTTLSPFDYIVEFINQETEVKSYIVLGTELSSYTNRFNKFTITEKTSPNNQNAEVNLTEGVYEYKVYEVSDASAVSPLSSVTSVGTVIEYGMCTVYDSPSTDTVYSGATSTNVVYEG
jgi:hypothetical protein